MPAIAQSGARWSAPDYANPANWLCRPARGDACSRPLPTTELSPAGYGKISQAPPAAETLVDCFYVYPTVSSDPGDNSDMAAGIEEQTDAEDHFARFRSVCRPYAPLYRQATFNAFQKAMNGTADIDQFFASAYPDVAAAWRHYLRYDNMGRPFVLIGHSQGSVMLAMLLAREIEGKPEAARLLSAMLIGYNVQVPDGKLVGGTFQSTPLCTRLGETGCVVTYVSFRAGSPPQKALGYTGSAGMTIGCTNPAGFAREPVPLDSYWYVEPPASDAPTLMKWSSQGPPPTHFLHTPGLVSAACVHDGPRGYLAIQVNADPNDARTDRIPGDYIPRWGLHIVDVNLAMGNLIGLIRAQSEAYRRQASIGKGERRVWRPSLGLLGLGAGAVAALIMLFVLTRPRLSRG